MSLSPSLPTAAASAAAQQQASPVNLVAEYLKSPDDLTKIPALRKKLAKEHASLSAKLKSGAKDQLEATRDGLLKLQATRKDVASVSEAFAQIERLNLEASQQGGSENESGSGVTDQGRSFRLISEVSQIHRNFVQTASTLQKLLSLPPQIESISLLLAESRADLFNPAPNLLPIHLKLSTLETFRNETMQLGRACSSDVRATLSNYFAPLDALVKEFEEYLFEIGEHALDLAREGLGGVIVRAVKIVEKESREDEKAAAIRLAKKANLEGAARFRSVIANARVIKLYRPKFLGSMDKAVKELFDECWGRFGSDADGGTGDPLDFLSHLDWVYKDLEAVRDELSPLFPPDYEIYRYMVKSYQKHLGALLRVKILATDPEANSLLTLYQFTQEYRKTLTSELNVEAKWLEPSLLAGKEQSIIDDYLGLITRKIDEWTANLMSDEVREFVARENAPDEDSEGLYGLQGAVILFQMVNQQVDLAADSGQASVLAKVVQHACKSMRGTQSTWTRVLEQEWKKQREAKKPEDITGGLVEYVIALANDQLKCADYAEALSSRLEPLVSSKYKLPIKEAVEESINGFLDVSKRSTQVLVDVIFSDLRPAVKDLFTFPNWYAEGTTTTIVETIRDYVTDYAERLNPALFDVLLDDVIERFLVAYISSLRRASKLRMPAAADRMRDDVRDSMAMFSSWRKEEEIGEKMEILTMILSLLTSSSTMVFLTYWSFAKAHGAQLAFLESLMKARDDLDKADVSAIMDSARRKVKSENMPDIPESGPTVMSRAAAAHATGLAANILAGLGVGGGNTSSSSTSQGSGGQGNAGANGEGAASTEKGWSSLAQTAGNYLGTQWRGQN